MPRQIIVQRIVHCLAHFINNSTVSPYLFCPLLLISVLQMGAIISESPISSTILDGLENSQNNQIPKLYQLSQIHNSGLNLLLRWFDPSLFIDQQKQLLFIISAPIFLISICLLTQICYKLKQKTISCRENNYLFRICITLCYILNYGMLPIVLRTTISLLFDQVQTYLTFLSVLALSLYILVLYCFILFVLNQVSWNSQRVTATIAFPNALTYYNLLRLLICFIIIPVNLQKRTILKEQPISDLDYPVYTLIISLLAFATLLYNLIRYPIISRKNTVIHSTLTLSCYFFLIRVLELVLLMRIQIIVIILAGALSHFSMRWMNERRIFEILLKKKQNQSDKHFRQRMRILCYLANRLCFKNQHSCKKILDRFLIQHHRYCNKPTCKCNELLNFNYLKPQYASSLQKSFKNFSVIKRNADGNQSQEILRIQNNLQYIGKLRDEKKLWFLLIFELIEERYSGLRKDMEMMTQSARLNYLQKMSTIGIDQSYILYEYYSKTYSAVQQLKTLKKQFDEHNFMVLHFRIQYTILLEILEAEVLNSIKELGSIKSNNRFASLQLKLIDFRSLIFKSIETGIKFWDEMGEGIDQSDIDARVQQLDECLNQVRSQYDYLAQLYGFMDDTNELNREIAGSSTYERTWNLKVQKVINEFYLPFHAIFDKTVQNLEEEFLKYEFWYDNKDKNIVKLMNIYDSDSKLPMCMIDINQGKDFTKICQWNTEFWKFTEYKYSPKMRICDLLIEEFVHTHTYKMSHLLMADHIELPVLHTFIKTTNVHFREVDFYGTIFLNLLEGFRFSIFWQKTRNHQRAIFLSKNSDVIGYTHELQQSVEQEQSFNITQLIQEIEKTQKSRSFKFNQKRCIDVCGVEVQLNYFHATRNLEEAAILKVFEVSFVNMFTKNISSNQTVFETFIPKEMKQIKKQGRERRSSYYFEEANTFDEQIEKLSETIQNDKKCKIVTRWFWVNFALFLCIQVAALWAIASATIKQDYYSSVYYENKNFSEFYLSMVHLSFNLRRMNILAYEKSMGYSSQKDIYSKLGKDDQVKKFQIYQAAIRLDIDKIDELEEGIDFDWNQVISSYNFYGSKPPTNETISLRLLKNKYILSSAIYLSSQSIENLSFSQFFQEIPLPLQPQAQNLYNALFNNNYILLDLLKQAFEQNQFVIWNCLDIFLMAPNYSCLILILICLFIFVYSLYVIRKIKNVVNISFEMLSHLHKEFVENRKSQFQKYRNHYLFDLLIESQTRNRILTKQSAHYSRGLTRLQKSSRDLEIKQLLQLNKSIFQAQNPEDASIEQGKRFQIFSLSKTSHAKQYLLIKLRLLPIIVLAIIAIYYQSFCDQKLKTLMLIAHPLQEFTQNVFDMRNAIHQAPFQNRNIISEELSLNGKKDEIIDSIYQQLKELTLNLDKTVVQETSLRFQQIKYSKYCQILELISKSSPYENIYEDCVDNAYSDKSPDQFFVYLIETARVHSISVDDQNVDFEYRRHLYENINPYLFEQIGSFEYRIVKFIREGLEIDLQRLTHNYFISMLEIELSIIGVSLVVAIFWVRKLKRTLYSQTSKVKTIFKLISFKSLKTHSELKRKISQHFQDFDCLQ